MTSRSKANQRTDDNPQWRLTCLKCGKLLTGKQRRFCSDSCEILWGRKHNPVREAEHLSNQRRFNHTEKGRAIKAKSGRRYFQSSRGKQWLREWRSRWYQTLNGMVYLERHKNTWHGRTNYLIYVLEMPCVGCGGTDKFSLTGDHVLPRALGGTDDWGNLQVLCRKCHKFKTFEHDFVMIRLFGVLKLHKPSA